MKLLPKLSLRGPLVSIVATVLLSAIISCAGNQAVDCAIERRDDCCKPGDTKECETEAYQSRMLQRQIVSGQLATPTAIGLNCGDIEQAPFKAEFYNDASPPAVVLTRGQDQVIAFIARSGSGARYTAEGVEFWEHQGQANVDWFGTKLVCAVEK